MEILLFLFAYTATPNQYTHKNVIWIGFLIRFLKTTGIRDFILQMCLQYPLTKTPQQQSSSPRQQLQPRRAELYSTSQGTWWEHECSSHKVKNTEELFFSVVISLHTAPFLPAKSTSAWWNWVLWLLSNTTPWVGKCSAVLQEHEDSQQHSTPTFLSHKSIWPRTRSLTVNSRPRTAPIQPHAARENTSRAVRAPAGKGITNAGTGVRSNRKAREGTFGLVSTTYMKGLPGLASLMACSICSSSRQRALKPERGWLQRHMAACNTRQLTSFCCPVILTMLWLGLSVLVSASQRNCYLNGHTESLLEYSQSWKFGNLQKKHFSEKTFFSRALFTSCYCSMLRTALSSVREMSRAASTAPYSCPGQDTLPQENNNLTVTAFSWHLHLTHCWGSKVKNLHSMGKKKTHPNPEVCIYSALVELHFRVVPPLPDHQSSRLTS